MTQENIADGYLPQIPPHSRHLTQKNRSGFSPNSTTGRSSSCERRFARQGTLKNLPDTLTSIGAILGFGPVLISPHGTRFLKNFGDSVDCMSASPGETPASIPYLFQDRCVWERGDSSVWVCLLRFLRDDPSSPSFFLSIWAPYGAHFGLGLFVPARS